METISFPKVKRQAMGPDAALQLNLGWRHCIMGLGPFLTVFRARHRRVLEDLRRADLQYVQDTCVSFASVLSHLLHRPAPVQARATEDTSFGSNQAPPR